MDQQEATQEEAVQADMPGMEAPEQQPASGGEYDKGDYIARIMHEPDFAAEQVREKDRQINEVKQALKKVEGLDRFVDAAGGVDNLIELVNTGYTVSNNPQVREVVDGFLRTGQLPAAEQSGQEDDEDPYEDPSVKSLRKELREAKDALSKMQGEYNQRFAQAETRSLQTGIEGNIKKFMDSYGVNDALREKIASEINSRVTQGQKAAQGGDQQALNMLSMLAGEHGLETLTRIAAPVLLDPENMRAIASARETKKAQTVAQQSTGSPSAARTAGGGEPAAVNYGPGFVREALEKATKNAGRDPNRLW